MTNSHVASILRCVKPMTPRQLFRLRNALNEVLADDVFIGITEEEFVSELIAEGIDPAELAARLKADFERLFAED